LIRKVFEEENTFDGAVQKLRDINIGATNYYIISGVSDNEGVVIERNPDGVHALY